MDCWCWWNSGLRYGGLSITRIHTRSYIRDCPYSCQFNYICKSILAVEPFPCNHYCWRCLGFLERSSHKIRLLFWLTMLDAPPIMVFQFLRCDIQHPSKLRLFLKPRMSIIWAHLRFRVWTTFMLVRGSFPSDRIAAASTSLVWSYNDRYRWPVLQLLQWQRINRWAL